MRALFIDSAIGAYHAIELPDEQPGFSSTVIDLLQAPTFLISPSQHENCLIIQDKNGLYTEGNIAFFSMLCPGLIFGNAILIGIDPSSKEKADLCPGITPDTFPVFFLSWRQTSQQRWYEFNLLLEKKQLSLDRLPKEIKVLMSVTMLRFRRQRPPLKAEMPEKLRQTLDLVRFFSHCL